MGSNNQDEARGEEPKSATQGSAKSQGSPQLFGHKGGSKPWEDPSETAATVATAPQPAPTSSAPYPRDARYTPRPEAEVTPPVSDDAGALDDDGELTKLHPNYKLLMRVGGLILALIFMLVAIVLDTVLQSEAGVSPGFIMLPALIVALFLVIRLPNARYNSRGYQISADRLRVVRGVLWHSDTVVPFGRIQHIDVNQGPIERALGIATLTLHTAGSHNASVRLPGLGGELATEMREDIREHIKRESM